MSRTRYTKELYETLKEGYRRNPGNHAAAARYAGTDQRTSARAYNDGWKLPKTELPWARPIKLALSEDDERERRRSADSARRERDIADAATAKRLQAQADAINEEGALLSGVRKSALGATSLLAKLYPAMNALCAVVASAVLDPSTGKPIPNPPISPAKAMRIILDFNLMVARLTKVEESIVATGRTDRGETNVNIGVFNLDDADALEEIRGAAMVHDRLAAKARLLPGAEEDEEVHH